MDSIPSKLGIILPDNVPAALKEIDHWALCRCRSRNGKTKKVPYAKNGTRCGSSTNPESWTTFLDAVQQAKACQMDGVMFAIQDTDILFLDLDRCRDKTTGKIEPWAQEIVEEVDSYTEISPSLEGLHIFAKGKLPKNGKVKLFPGGGRLELYSAGLFATVTGNHLEGTPREVEERDASVSEIYLEYFGIPHKRKFMVYSNRLDAEDWLSRHALEILRDKSINGGRLYEIPCPGSHGNYDKRDRRGFVFQHDDGGLFAGCLHDSCSFSQKTGNHWRELREMYEPEQGRRGASAGEESTGASTSATGTHTRRAELIVIRGDEATEKPLRWIWKPYLPLGKLVHFGGHSSQAKSPVTVNLAARTSTGTSWPDGTPNDQGPRSVILLNIEDDFEDTILPRFRLAGGDKKKLYYVKGTRIPADESEWLERGVILEQDMQAIVRLARDLTDLGMIVIDPITNYLGAKNMIAEQDVRAILTPLASLAAELGPVVITVGHLNRREKGTDPLLRMMGAGAFVGVARAVYLFGPDPDEESKYCHVMSVLRGCGGEGSSLRYRTELVSESCPDSFSTEIIRVVWTGKSDATAEDVADSASSREKAQEDEAAEKLNDILRDGGKPSQVCTALLKAEGYDLEKLNACRVRKKAGAKSQKKPGDGFYTWYLPISTPGA